MNLTLNVTFDEAFSGCMKKVSVKAPDGSSETLDELGDKVSADKKSEAESAIEDAKSALSGSDIEAIKAASARAPGPRTPTCSTAVPG